MVALGWQAKLGLYAGGVYSTFLVYGVLVEKMEKARFGGEPFHHWLFVTLVSALVNALLAYIVLRLSGRSHSVALTPAASSRQYATVALAQSIASASALAALSYVDFPTQTLGKCAKPVSILVGDLALPSPSAHHQPYSPSKSLSALLVCLGIALFMLMKPGTSTALAVSPLGYALILTSLACDGLVGALQKRLKAPPGGPAPSPFQLMLWVNIWSALLILLALVARGDLIPSLHFLVVHPFAAALVVGLNISMAFGQLFIYLLLGEFDPLVCSLTTTTRKFFSILASVIIYGNPVSSGQWVGVGLVFSGLLLPELSGIIRKAFAKPVVDNKKKQ